MLAPGYLQGNEGVISLVEQCSNIEFPNEFSIGTASMGLSNFLFFLLSIN